MPVTKKFTPKLQTATVFIGYCEEWFLTLREKIILTHKIAECNYKSHHYPMQR